MPPASPASLPAPLLLLPLLLLEPLLEPLELLLPPLEDDELVLLERIPLELPEELPVVSAPASPGVVPFVSSPHASHAPAAAMLIVPMMPILRSVFVMGVPYSDAAVNATVS
jgi:hypothetical protein